MKINRETKYAVIPVSALRAIQARTDEEVVEAQRSLNPDVIGALEELVNAAKSDALSSGDQALGIAALMR